MMYFYHEIVGIFPAEIFATDEGLEKNGYIKWQIFRNDTGSYQLYSRRVKIGRKYTTFFKAIKLPQ